MWGKFTKAVSIVTLFSSILGGCKLNQKLDKDLYKEKGEYFVYVTEGLDSKRVFKKYEDEIKVVIDYDHLDASVVLADENSLERLVRSGEIEFFVENKSKMVSIKDYDSYLLSISNGSDFPVEEGIHWSYKRVHHDEPAKNEIDGDDIKVAIMDTGIYQHHEKFRERIKKFYDFVYGKTGIYDRDGHGSLVAGIIISILPKCDLYVYKVHGMDGSNMLSDLLEGFDQMIADKVDVVNMSYGLNLLREFEGRSQENAEKILEEALERTWKNGTIIVAAAGNDSDYPNEENNKPVHYPARSDYVIAVGAIRQNNEISTFCSLGGDLYAPGEKITTFFEEGELRRYGYPWAGTSFAAPFVTAAVATIEDYCQENNIAISDEEKIRLLLNSVDEENTIISKDHFLKDAHLEEFGVINFEKLMDNLKKLRD